MIEYYHQTRDFDAIRFRIVPWKQLDTGEQRYTLVEEKMKNGVAIADLRRVLDPEEFESLKAALNGVQV